jgi:acyl-coenzyme A thioesterase PaaI-like protein
LPQCAISEIKPFHLGGIGQEFVNGAIMSAMLDFALGLTGLKYATLGSFATCTLNIDIARPIEKGRFYAIAKGNRKIGKKVYSEATIFNAQDEPCVYATGILKVGITHV